MRQCTCSCSCEQCALLQRCRQVRYTKPATLRTFEAVELERDRLSEIQIVCGMRRDAADTLSATAKSLRARTVPKSDPRRNRTLL